MASGGVPVAERDVSESFDSAERHEDDGHFHLRLKRFFSSAPSTYSSQNAPSLIISPTDMSNRLCP